MLNTSTKTENIDSKEIILMHEEKDNENLFNSANFKEEYKNNEQDRNENKNNEQDRSEINACIGDCWAKKRKIK